MNSGGDMISLITGASSGIGRDMAFEFADRGYDLILVARSFDRLKEVKNEIIKNGSGIYFLIYYTLHIRLR